MAANVEQCCDKFVLKWTGDNVLKYKKLMPSPAGLYRKQTLLNKHKIVYYNNASEYYLFHNENEWLVSLISKTIK